MCYHLEKTDTRSQSCSFQTGFLSSTHSQSFVYSVVSKSEQDQRQGQRDRDMDRGTRTGMEGHARTEGKGQEEGQRSRKELGQSDKNRMHFLVLTKSNLVMRLSVFLPTKEVYKTEQTQRPQLLFLGWPWSLWVLVLQCLW